VLIIFTAITIIGVSAVKITERRERQKAFAAETARVGGEMRTEMQSELGKKGSISPETALKGMEKMRDQIAKGGSDPARLIADFANDIVRVTAPYAEIAKRMQAENPFDPATIKERGDLVQRRTLGERMLKQNGVILAFLEGAEVRFRTKLEKAGLTQSSIDEGMEAFAKGFTTNLASGKRMRQLDAVVAGALIEQCNLLDAEWGKWHIENNAIACNSNVLLAKLNALRSRVKNAAEEEARIQQELLSKPRS
jgi:hypothetical protein